MNLQPGDAPGPDVNLAEPPHRLRTRRSDQEPAGRLTQDGCAWLEALRYHAVAEGVVTKIPVQVRERVDGTAQLEQRPGLDRAVTRLGWVDDEPLRIDVARLDDMTNGHDVSYTR